MCSSEPSLSSACAQGGDTQTGFTATALMPRTTLFRKEIDE